MMAQSGAAIPGHPSSTQALLVSRQFVSAIDFFRAVGVFSQAQAGARSSWRVGRGPDN